MGPVNVCLWTIAQALGDPRLRGDDEILSLLEIPQQSVIPAKAARSDVSESGEVA